MRPCVIVKRLLWMLPTLGVITLLSYGMMRAAPGDPVRAAMLAGSQGDGPGEGERKEGESVAAREFRRRYHLDQPWIIGYWRWLVGHPEAGRGGWLHGEWPGFGADLSVARLSGHNPDDAALTRLIRLDVPAPLVSSPALANPMPPGSIPLSSVPEDEGHGTETPEADEDSFISRVIGHVGWFVSSCHRVIAGQPGRNRGGIIHGDFGTSIVTHRGMPVWDVLKGPMWVTVRLQLWAMAVIYMVALPFGLYSAVFRGSWTDRSVSFLFFVLYSLPSFWVGLLLIMLAAHYVPWWPISGMAGRMPPDASYWAILWDSAKHYVLPVFCLSFGAFASLSRFARASVLEVIRQDFVRTARAKGLSEWTVMTKHVLRNSLITMVTLFAGLLPGLLGGSIIIEYLFTINGMGSMMQQALASRDYPILMTDFGLGAALVLVGIFLSDILYTVVDPRIELN